MLRRGSVLKLRTSIPLVKRGCKAGHREIPVFLTSGRTHLKLEKETGPNAGPGSSDTDSSEAYGKRLSTQGGPLTTPGLAIFNVAGTFAYLGLAVLGAGGITSFLSHGALIALGIVLFALSGAGLFSSGNVSPGEQEDRSNRWVIGAVSLIGLLLGYVPAYTDRIGFFAFDGDVLRWIGVFLFAAGGMLRIWPVFVLGRRFSGLVAIQPGHTLVTSGVYGVIRHPSYLGLLINSLGWALAFRSGVGTLLAALLIPVLLARIHAEERLLAARFGAEYDAYRARTWRLIPRIY